MKIAVAGATGRVGHHVVDVLRTMGQDVVGMSRSMGVDIVTGAGLDKALQGVKCIIDASSGPSPDQKAATEFFTSASRNLLNAGKKADVKRIVVISIIGIDRFTTGYMAAKIEHEKMMKSGPIPVRILRAAQFHEFVPQMIEWGTQGKVSHLPKMRTQLVAARSVAEILAELAVELEGKGRFVGATMLEIAGPRPEQLADAAKKFVDRRGSDLRIKEVNDPADPESLLYESGALLPGPKAILGGPTFDEWLHSTVFEAEFATR